MPENKLPMTMQLLFFSRLTELHVCVVISASYTSDKLERLCAETIEQ